MNSVANFGDFAPNRRYLTCDWRKIFLLATGDFLATLDFFTSKVQKVHYFAKNLRCTCSQL